jgi:hypothetical protein
MYTKIKYIFQPIESLFSWSFTSEQLQKFKQRLDKHVCEYCILDNGICVPQYLYSISYKLYEEDAPIRRIHITFNLKIKGLQYLDDIIFDINRQLDRIEMKYDGKCKFYPPNTPVKWNPMQIISINDLHHFPKLKLT